ncbi:MAG TPA: nuclear transport factor 2 family protein [Jatrophihabitantaceae bacterium]
MSEADVITRMLHAIDRLDWTVVRESFAPVVATDYTSLWGGEPADVRAELLIAQWQEFTANLAATHHQTGPIVVSDGRAETHVTAVHWLPNGDAWTVHGHYIAQLANGKIAALTLQTFRASGHEGLPTVEARRPWDGAHRD